MPPAPFETLRLAGIGVRFELERLRDLHFEAEGADLQDVAVAEQGRLDALAVDACAGPAAAIADPVAVGGPLDEAVQGRDFVAVETEVAAAGSAHCDDVALDVAGLL